MQKIVIGSDHAGFPLKEEIIRYLNETGYEVTDKGCFSTDACDYPDMADAVCTAIPQEGEFGILICGSGIGVGMRANRYPHIRAALVHDHLTARLSRQHNNANVITLGARLIGVETARDAVAAFISEAFAAGRHQPRVDKLAAPIKN